MGTLEVYNHLLHVNFDYCRCGKKSRALMQVETDFVVVDMGDGSKAVLFVDQQPPKEGLPWIELKKH